MVFARSLDKVLLFLIFVAAISCASSSTCAADSPGEQAKPVPSGAALPNCSAADNAWILVSSALVLMMTAPGLALFYCGLVRKKNGRIDHVDVTVDDRTATVTAMTYIYKDGGSISFQQTYAVVDGNYVIKAQSGKVDLPSYHADVASTFSNYKLNVPIDQQVFATD